MLPAPAFAQVAEPVIGVSSRSFNPGFSNMWIGQALGLFGKDIQPKSVGTQGASENLQLMLSGQITMSTGTQDIILTSAAEGRKLPAVIPCVYLRGVLHRISVLPNSPITGYADLKGKRIGVPTLAYGGVGYLKFALRHAGIAFADVNLVAVGDGQQAAVALDSGRIDALLNADVDVVRLKTLGVNVRVLDQPDNMKNAATAYVFAFARPWYEGHKAEALGILKGLIRSIIVMTENPEAAVRVSYYMHPASIPSGISREKAISDAVTIIKTRAPLISRDAAANDKWCSFSKENWTDFVEILGLEGKVDPMDFYTSELIDGVNTIDDKAMREWARGLKVPETDAEIAKWLAGLKPPL
ncbi:ABC transporter substrate-binding protein [Aquabacter spiritensis]|uniref:ABC-type nitrate/sulfonate/bicarbonate transport system substrate-binding protein n=1 Tax=Aquabacter spiritensis TaxID=933073 RepID=A0A4R3M0V8_9HYPH|nr:ABC transporter substrate-binding protein [Aquabacter spiritensis]TCT06714.1 ABC-type nitrate/sulfonate/bicarbonate transport system substrate-binding protein [Aquabacter spiritensis]